MDSRASGVTEAFEAGVSDDDINKQTGHVDKVMVQEVYTRDSLEVSEGRTNSASGITKPDDKLARLSE